jgi:hypothetical protein
MPNGWRPDGLKVSRECAFLGPGFSERRLELLENKLVRFENGDAHGRWELEDDLDLYLTFNYAADTSKMKNLHFKRISRTDDFVLDAKEADWFVVLCRRSPPVQAAD